MADFEGRKYGVEYRHAQFTCGFAVSAPIAEVQREIARLERWLQSIDPGYGERGWWLISEPPRIELPSVQIVLDDGSEAGTADRAGPSWELEPLAGVPEWMR